MNRLLKRNKIIF